MDDFITPLQVPDPRKRMRRLAVSALALALAAGQAAPAFATIDNTATASGTGPSGPVSANATENVDVENANPQILVTKTSTLTTDVDGDNQLDPGDVVQYSYAVQNDGNVTLVNVGINDTHDTGTLTISAPLSVTTDNTTPAGAGRTGDSNDSTNPGGSTWDRLGPGDVITFTASYTVLAADMTDPDLADGTLDNTAVPVGETDPDNNLLTAGTSATDTSTDASESIPVDNSARMTVAKVADDTTDVIVGQTITYTYTVTNTGNVAITNVTLADLENGANSLTGPTFSAFGPANGSTNTGNTLTSFTPGAVATFTATYVVHQTDVNTLQ
jgi:uncharacterized repeat protein (TIGR01451 family)